MQLPGLEQPKPTNSANGKTVSILLYCNLSLLQCLTF
jgi:hypothetical protein